MRDGDVVAPDELPAFLAEIAAVRACSKQLAVETRPPDRATESHRHHIFGRLAGVQASTRYAQGAGGGLLIW
ncbi:hypothetical protein ABZT34_33760 [Streptomyces sp. NPDC005329]|uniref:hypothetical protein n=1 Tax=Streptomyces sp. NPDC005329 TaxID=3157034 RepID=UPI0033BE7337